MNSFKIVNFGQSTELNLLQQMKHPLPMRINLEFSVIDVNSLQRENACCSMEMTFAGTVNDSIDDMKNAFFEMILMLSPNVNVVLPMQ